MKRILFRGLLLAGALAYAVALVISFAGELATVRPTVPNLERGLQWNRWSPSLWSRYGSSWTYDSSEAASGKALNAFLRAAELNPLDPANWEGLASVYLQTWNGSGAEAALRSWLRAMPQSPEGAWRLGNLLILQDRPKEAFPYLKAAATIDPQYRMPLFDLAWKVIADPDVILHELVPAGRGGRLPYLEYLVRTKRFSEAKQVWPEVNGDINPSFVWVAYFYLDGLIGAGLSDDATKVWADLLADTGRSAAKRSGALLTNDDFEAGLPNVGLDWRILPGPGYQISLDDSVAQSGSHSLLVNFDGSANPDFGNVYQFVPVQPSHDYRFRGYIKTENITTDSGARFAVLTVNSVPSENVELRTENRLGTNPWTLEQLDFRTGPDTHFVLIKVRRLSSAKLNNLILGKVWVDNLSLEARP